MSNEQMLEELIELAVKNGFNFVWIGTKLEDLKWDLNPGTYCGVGDFIVIEDYEDQIYPVTELLFNHDFAKAVFGKQKHKHDPYMGACKNCGCVILEYYTENCYKYHLQQLAITPEEDRIQYAYENRRQDDN